VVIDRLNKIYSEQYKGTVSYFELQQILNEYEKINVNLIMLKMAIIVESENEFD
jgi:hypothetical protein